MVRRFLVLGAILAALVPVPAGARDAADGRDTAKLDGELRERARAPRGNSRVILHLDAGASACAVLSGAGWRRSEGRWPTCRTRRSRPSHGFPALRVSASTARSTARSSAP